MGGEDQLKALIRHGFALQNTADKAVIRVDRVLAQAMANVKRMIEALPQGSLLRNQSWKQMEPIVQKELSIYGNQLGKAITDALVEAAPGMEQAAIREAQLAGANFGPEYIRLNPAGGRTPKTVEMALNSRVNQRTLRKLFRPNSKTQQSLVDKALFRTVDTKVRAGIIEGKTTDAIADEMVQDVMRQGVPGVSLNTGVAKQIRGQANAIARTATQDMARQVKYEVYDNNADAMEGMAYQWSAALDSKTCETCGPLDGRRYTNRKQAPTWPIHPNCRCQLLAIDPEDPFWNDPEITAQQIRPVDGGKGPYTGKGAYKTPITIKGKRYWRKAVPVTSDTPPPRYSDVLAKWATTSQPSLKAALGPARAAWFTNQYEQFNRDPQQILEAMLTGKRGAQQWIPIDQLRDLKSIVKRAASIAVAAPPPPPKPKPKPKPTPAPTPAPEPASLSPEEKAAQKAALFAQQEEARKKAKALKQKAVSKLASDGGINSASLNRALAAAAKPVVKAPPTIKWSSLDGVDPVPLFDNSKDVLGRGFMGIAKLTPKGVVKSGQIAKAEVEALKLMRGSGVTPEFLGVTYQQGTKFKSYMGLSVARPGMLMMKTAPGQPLVKVGKLKGAEALDAFDQFLGARKAMHLKGIAHQDMHLANVLWDQKTSKLTVIDLGVARIDPRSALIEALGSRRGEINFGKIEKAGDFQSAGTWRWMNPGNASANNSKRWKRFAANRKQVEALLKQEGLGDEFKNASIRKLPRAISAGMSKQRAMDLLEMLYEGV